MPTSTTVLVAARAQRIALALVSCGHLARGSSAGALTSICWRRDCVARLRQRVQTIARKSSGHRGGVLLVGRCRAPIWSMPNGVQAERAKALAVDGRRYGWLGWCSISVGRKRAATTAKQWGTCIQYPQRGRRQIREDSSDMRAYARG